MNRRPPLLMLYTMVLASLFGCAENVHLKTKVPKSNPSYRWHQLVDQVASDNGVRFDILKKRQRRLNQYVAWIGEHGQHRDGWTESKEDKRIAHLINSHNAVVLHNAIRNGLPDSPDAVDVGLYRWPEAGFYWGTRYKFDGEWSGLRHIAIHDTVNRYQDPLLWMGLYDGTKDSPPLRFFTAKALKKEIRQAARDFINSDRGMNKTDAGWAGNPVFFRYQDDFLFWSTATTICDWLAKYAQGERLEWLLSQGDTCALETREANRELDRVVPVPAPSSTQEANGETKQQ